MESKIIARVGAKPRDETKYGFKGAIKSNITEFLFEFYPVGPVAEPAVKPKIEFWQYKAIVKTNRSKILVF